MRTQRQLKAYAMPKKPLTPNPARKFEISDDIADVTGLRRRILRSCTDDDETANRAIRKIQCSYKMPPQWKQHEQQTIADQLTYRKFRVSSSSIEYSVISSLLDPVPITKVEQIVNPTLWNKFDLKRKDMIKSKSDDAAVLADIGLNKEQMIDVLQYMKNFPLHPKVAAVPYNDNMNLLFHCTRKKENIDGILTTGLDERIGNGGYLGRGIYFTDNPKKSMVYDSCGVIFLCAVLLGDCLSMNKNQDMDRVREPPKVDEQKRNFNDLCFDSIVGRPGGKDNEYVIYDRYISNFRV